VIVFRHCDRRLPFLWETADQPPGRWHAEGDGPTQYLADTPDGAWAEFLRHEEITDPADVETVRRSIWAIEIEEGEARPEPRLPLEVLTGGWDSHESCQQEALRLRDAGATSIQAPSAALLPGEARGWRVAGGTLEGPRRDGSTIVLFGARPTVTGWQAVAGGAPPPDLLTKVRHFD
jgi:hypothetical protein